LKVEAVTVRRFNSACGGDAQFSLFWNWLGSSDCNGKKIRTNTQFSGEKRPDWPDNGLKRQESCAIAKMTAQYALHMGALNIFGTP